MNILITGGSGLIGTKLTEILLATGHSVSHLSRSKQASTKVKTYLWDIAQGKIDDQALLTADCIVHLAGAGIADGNWTKARKKEIIDSRTQSLSLIAKRLGQLNHSVKTLVSSSAIGYYGGDTGDVEQDENSKAGDDFLAETCVAWEAATKPIADMGIRTVILRTGIVISKLGGALPKLAAPVKLGLGAALASGQQWQSWIHLNDMAAMFKKACEDSSMQGIYNGVAPNPVSNETMTFFAAKALNRPFILPNVPAFVLKVLFGEMSIVVIGGSYIQNHRIATETNFEYQFPEIKEALVAELSS